VRRQQQARQREQSKPNAEITVKVLKLEHLKKATGS